MNLQRNTGKKYYLEVASVAFAKKATAPHTCQKWQAKAIVYIGASRKKIRATLAPQILLLPFDH
jgi:hypothetical protein